MKNPEEALFEEFAVYELWSQDVAQNIIASQLNLTEPRVSQIIKEGKKQKKIYNGVNLVDGISGDMRDKIRNRIFDNHENLLNSLKAISKQRNKVSFKSIDIIYPRSLKVAKSGDSEQLVRDFGVSASGHITELISSAGSVAVAWGRTIRSIVDAIGTQPSSNPEIDFIPLAGEPFNTHAGAASATVAAQDLRDKFHGKAYNLLGVAARIPKDLSGTSDIKTIKRFYRACDDYRKIFGDAENDLGIINEVEMILTGVGSVATSKNDPLFEETEKLEELQQGKISHFSAGNIGGVWLPKNRDDKAHIKQVAEINRRWLGVQHEQFAACAQRASAQGAKDAPGVTVVAVEEDKVEALYQSLGLINRLVISADLAKALYEKLDKNGETI